MCCAQLFQSYQTLCDPTDHSPPDYSVHGIFQARYWSGLPCLPHEDHPDPGIDPASSVSPALQAGSLPLSRW